VNEIRRLEPLLPWGVLALGLALAAAVSLASWRWSKGVSIGQSIRTSVLDGLLVCSAIVVVVLTLGPATTPPGRRLDLIPFRELVTEGFDRTNASIEMLGNVVLFIPIAFLAAQRFPRLRSTSAVLVWALSLSLLLEGLQFAMAPGRECSATDVILNVLGASVGYRLFCMTTPEPHGTAVTAVHGKPRLNA
jgi:glycopeptide antibiotics resistance protein